MTSSNYKQKEFSMTVEELVMHDDMTYMDALIHIMEKENLDEEAISKLVKKNAVLKMKLELESQNLNLIEKETVTLPL